MAQFEMNWLYMETDNSANLARWWKGIEFPTNPPETDSEIAAWLADFASRYEICFPGTEIDREMTPDSADNKYAVSYRQFAKTLNLFDPRVSRVNGADQIIIYESGQKREAGKRLALNPGKAIRRIIPTMPDRYLEKAVDEFKVKFDSAAYEIKWGETRDDFKFAYLGINYAPTSNVRFSDWRKSLANSCMRHDFRDEGLGNIHPAEVYASGDFRMLMAIQKETGKVAARCVVRIDTSKVPRPEYIHAPIYTANDNAADLLESALSEVFAEKAGYTNRQFSGARLLHLKCRHGIVAPYQDVGPARIDRPDSDDEYLTLCSNGDLHYGTTSGYIRHNSCECHECGAECDEDSDYQDDNGYYYCESCYSEEFGYCEDCEDSNRHDDMTTVYHWNSYRGRPEERSVCDCCRRNNYTECDEGNDSGEYWSDNDILRLANGNAISPRDYEDSYFTSDYSGEIFDNDERVETEDGESIAQSEAEKLGLVELPSGDWGKADMESLAQQAKDETACYELGAAHEVQRAGQSELGMILPRGVALEFDSLGEFEFPVIGGLAQWRIAESVALSQFPEIGKICRDGSTWYYFTDCRLPYNDSQIREFATLAECVSAVQSMKG